MSQATVVRGRRPMSDVRRARLRLEISREAVRLFRRHGVAATSGEQIADAVGLSVRTLWRYFRSKEACVEPLLSQSVDAFVDVLRRWPSTLPLEEHLIADHGDRDAGADAEAALAVIGMSRHEPALRAIWLVVYERAEPVLAEVIAARTGLRFDDVAVRVQAAALCAALRITTEDLAAATADGVAIGAADGVAIGTADGSRPPSDAAAARLSEAVHAATHGLLGDPRPSENRSARP